MRLFIIYLLLFNSISLPQDFDKAYISNEIKNFETLFKFSKVAYPGDSSVDIKYYKLDLAVTYSPKLLRGKVTVKASPLQNNLNIFFLDLYYGLKVDSVMHGEHHLIYTQDSSNLKISLDNNYQINQEFVVDIFYKGIPKSDLMGFIFSNHNFKPAIYTVSEPYSASYWWPCKDTPADKADSSDVWITCDQNFIGASNGILEEVLTNGDGTKTYKWKNRYPIAHYLISLAIADYKEYITYYKYSPTDSMPVVNYIYPETFNRVKTTLDGIANMLNIYSGMFGAYPFLKEKYGYAQIPMAMGMENQSLTSIGDFAIELVSHEMAHQWFGDKITCRDWHHIWLNEGFATYAEALLSEAVDGRKNYKEKILNEMKSSQFADGSVYIKDISTFGKIFNYYSVYSKGAVVLHMLRGITGDSVFFKILRTYISDPSLAYSTAVTENFQAIAEKVFGSSLEYFFQEWIYGEDFPVYNVNFDSNASANNLYNITLNITQTQTSLFVMPIQIKISTTTGDTLITLFNNIKNQTFNFSVSSRPLSIEFDPENWILKSAIITNLEDNNSLAGSFSLQQNYPNPFNPSTKIKFDIPSNSSNPELKVSLKIYDILGNEMAVLINREIPSGAYEVNFDSRDKNGNPLPSGVYYYSLKAGDFSQTKKMLLLK